LATPHGKTTQKLKNDIRCSKTYFTQWAFLNKEQQAVSTTKAKGHAVPLLVKPKLGSMQKESLTSMGS